MDILNYHQSMLLYAERTGAYSRTIMRTMKPGDIVSNIRNRIN